MNPDADACADFYEYACGNWAKVHEESAFLSQLEQLDHAYHGQLATLLEQRQVENQPRFVQLLRDNYNACRKQKWHFKPAEFVRWLVTWGNISLDKEMETETSYSRLSMLLLLNHQLFKLPEDLELELESQLEAVKWLLSLQLPWPTGDAVVAEFLPLTRGQFRRLYYTLRPLEVPQQELWQKVKLLERQLCMLPQQEAEAEQETEAETGGTVSFSPDLWLLPLPLENSFMPIDTHWEYYKGRLPTLLATLSMRQLVVYARLRLLHKLQLRQTPNFGRQECAAQTRHLLTHAAVWLLQHKQNHTQRQLMHATVQQQFEQVRQRFTLRLLTNRNKFSIATQNFLLDKLQRMRLRVSVLPEGDHVTQRQLLEDHYAMLQLNDSDYYGNLLATLRQIELWNRDQDEDEDAKQDMESLFLVQSDGYGSYASPFFLPQSNLILLPHSLLATPIYRPHQLAALTQSALGFLIAHEMSHGFSFTDVHFDGRGNVAKTRQRSEITNNDRFDSKISCLRRHNYGMTDIDEKFADINGLSLAYEAFNATTPMANNTMRQVFFLNFAQFFCQDDSQMEDSLVHGGNRQRVNDAVANLKAFAVDFSCKWQKKHVCRLY